MTTTEWNPSFFVVPYHIISLPGMTLSFLKVYENIFQFWNKGKPCFLSDNILMERANIGQSQLYEAFAYFEKHNELIRRKVKGKRYLVRPEMSIEMNTSGKDSTSAGAEPYLRQSGSATSAGAEHNINNLNKEINNNKHIGAFENSHENLDENFSENNDFVLDEIEPEKNHNQILVKQQSKKYIDGSDESLSPVIEKIGPKKVHSESIKKQTDLKYIQENNIYQIPWQMIEDWNQNRIKKKTPITQTAWNKINKELAKCKEQGIEPIDAFENMVTSGWQSLKVEWFLNETKSIKSKRPGDALSDACAQAINQGGRVYEHSNSYQTLC